MICNNLLTLQKYTLLAWNYNQKMQDFKAVTSLDPGLFSEKVKHFIARYPKLAI